MYRWTDRRTNKLCEIVITTCLHCGQAAWINDTINNNKDGMVAISIKWISLGFKFKNTGVTNDPLNQSTVPGRTFHLILKSGRTDYVQRTNNLSENSDHRECGPASWNSTAENK